MQPIVERLIGFSIIMQYLLRLSLFLVFLRIGNATAVPLECEVCYATTSTCTGPKQKCPRKKDTCVISLSESTLDGKKIVITEKGCERSDICTAPFIDLYLGHGRFYRGSLNCCTGDSCQNVSLKLPEQQMKPNGKQCPACYAWTTTCQTEVVNCTGLDTYCFDVLSQINDGASLHCETCLHSTNTTGSSNGSSITCTGSSQLCAPNKDICMIAVVEHNLEGITEHIIEKSCAYSKFCKIGYAHLFVGKGKTYRSSIVCCKGNNCPKGPIPILPENTTPNGKECPGCFAWAKTCKTETVKCTGNDTHCIDVTSTRKLVSEGKYMDNVIKGCTTRSLCASLKQEAIPLFMGEVEKVVCTPEVSRGSQPTCFFLLTFFGLLLMKIFE